MKHEGWKAQAIALGVQLAPEAPGRLDSFQRLLVERGAPMGLISPGDVERVRERHVLDCLRAAPLVGSGSSSAYDLGSGGGLPGLVLAIVCPELQVTLVEVRRNRAAFLEAAIKELALERVSVYARRAETLRARADLCFARAFAPAPAAWALAQPLLAPGGRLIYWAGRTFAADRDTPTGTIGTLHQSEALVGAGPLLELRAA